MSDVGLRSRVASNGHRRAGLEALGERVTPIARRVAAGVAGPRPRLPSLRDLQRQLPNQALMATGQLAMALRELTGRDVIDLGTLQELMGFGLRVAMIRAQHRRGEWAVDEYGFDRDWTEALMPLFRIIANRYWRVETSGREHIPRTGGALLVSNHAGVLPLDGAMIKVVVHDATERHARALIASWLGSLPALSWFLRRTGQTLGHPADSDRLLRAGELVLVFPESVKGTGKPFSQRYRLRRFGRGGFVAAAIRARVPLVPISVVGSEETYPMIGDLTPIADLLGMPYFPITPTWPWLGPLGLLPLPSKWRIEFHQPVRTDQLPPRTADDVRRIMAVSDEIRDTIQAGVVRNLMERVRTFRG